MSDSKQNTFHLGLTMAGAVSAGSYTGGALDYLFEILHKWEQAKKGNLEGVDSTLVPTTNVMIDVMGGTSAGGMTTSMATMYALMNKINPVGEDQADNPGGLKNNIFYDSWVNLADKPGKLTIAQALSDADIRKTGRLDSLLNSDFIDEIAERAFKTEGDSGTNPAGNLAEYISDDLQLLISHTMLRGVPLEVGFSHNSTLKTPPAHSSYDHFLMSHFHLNKGEKPNEDLYMWLNPYNESAKKQMLDATIATGAFPVGLRYRKFDNSHFTTEYLKRMLTRQIVHNMGDADPELAKKIKWKDEMLEEYSSLSVDGGAINNEPYGEVSSILEANHDENCGEKKNYGVVMIDPFPDFHQDDKDYKEPQGLFGVVPNIIQTIWHQSKIKRAEMVDQFHDKAYRGVIFPMKHALNKEGKSIGKYKQPLATGMLGGFSGFIDLGFRHHDFYLGRDNARNFARAFLSLPCEVNEDNEVYEVHPYHESWTMEQRKRFLIKLKSGYFLPIIPDMNLLIKNIQGREESLKYTVPEFPQITYGELKKLKKPIRVRTRAILKTIKLKKSKDLGQNSSGGILGFFGGIIRWVAGIIAAKEAVQFLHKEFGENGFIKGYDVKEDDLIERWDEKG